jgi:hypothetical protein
MLRVTVLLSIILGTNVQFPGVAFLWYSYGILWKKEVDMKVFATCSQSLALFPVQFCTNQTLHCYK